MHVLLNGLINLCSSEVPDSYGKQCNACTVSVVAVFHLTPNTWLVLFHDNDDGDFE